MSDFLDEFDLTISTLWREARLSCPHKDVLQAYAERELPAAQLDYLRFHVEDVGCASCREALAELGVPPPRPALEDSAEERAVRERLLQSTRSALRSSRGSRRD